MEGVAEAGLVRDCKPVFGTKVMDTKATCTAVLTADGVGCKPPKKAYANVRTLQAHALTKQRQNLFFQTVNHAKVVWDPTVKPKGIFGGHLNIQSLAPKVMRSELC